MERMRGIREDSQRWKRRDERDILAEKEEEDKKSTELTQYIINNLI